MACYLPLVLTALTLISVRSFETSIFYCGFGEPYCGQSANNDVNSNADYVLLAFLNIEKDGSVSMDENNYPYGPVDDWKQSNKKVIASVGGWRGYWPYVFASEETKENFLSSLLHYVDKHELSGVDLAIITYHNSPREVASLIRSLKTRLGNDRLLIVSPQCVTVHKGVPVPSPDAGGQAWNYFVPIINEVDQYIDLYQPQAYNNWYGGSAAGSLQYLKEVYLGWTNRQSQSGAGPIPNFSGVRGEKLLLGLLGSQEAGIPDYYCRPEVVQGLMNFIHQKGHSLRGFMIWNSNWDSNNDYQISNLCKKSTGL